MCFGIPADHRGVVLAGVKAVAVDQQQDGGAGEAGGDADVVEFKSLEWAHYGISLQAQLARLQKRA